MVEMTITGGCVCDDKSDRLGGGGSDKDSDRWWL